MTDAERIWAAKSDDDLLEAAAELDTFTDEGKSVIKEELRRRGLEDPEEQARFIAPEESVKPREDESGLLAPNPTCVRCEVEQHYLGARRFLQTADSGARRDNGHPFAIDQAFDLYVCPKCGHVDMFIGGVDEDERPD